MNKRFNKIAGIRTTPIDAKPRKVKTNGATIDRIIEECKKQNLRFETDWLTKEYQVYNSAGEVIGRYDTIAEIKEALRNGAIKDTHNI